MKYYETLVFNKFGERRSLGGLTKSGYFNGYYGIQYNHSGSVQLSRDNEPWQVGEGPHVFFTYPGTLFSYGTPEGKSRHHCYLCFSGSLVQRFIDGGLIDLQRKKPMIKVVYAERFYSTFQKILQQLRMPGGAMNLRLPWMLEDLLLQIQEQPGDRVKINAYCERELQLLRERIVQDPLKEWNFQEEAKRFSVSYSYFRRIFREVIGCAPNQFLIEARLDYAVHLLESDTLPVSEIAHLCGFKDEFYFSRLFKKHKLVSPSALRFSSRRLEE